jgi:Kef-type K+ transport system membrane component KefB
MTGWGLQSVLAVALDAALFIALPWVLWRLSGRRFPFAVLPIIIGLLLAVFVPSASRLSVPVGQHIGLTGVLLLVFVAGMETRLVAASEKKTEAVTLRRLFGAAFMAALLPFVAGTLLAWGGLLSLPGWMPLRGQSWLSAAAIGLCLSVSALPVLVGIVREFEGRQRWLGNLAVRIAVIDDAALWSGLALLLLLAGEGQVSGVGFKPMLAIVILLVLIASSRIGWQLPRWLIWPLAAIWLAAGAWASNALGLQTVLGAYFAGASLPLAWSRRLPVERIGAVAWFVLAPLFFGHSGLHIDGKELDASTLLAAVALLLVSVASKLLAAWWYSPVASLPRGERLGLGVLLQCKGLIEIVAATMLIEQGLLSEHVFAILVVLAVFSTLLTGPLFKTFVTRAVR